MMSKRTIFIEVLLQHIWPQTGETSIAISLAMVCILQQPLFAF